MSPKILTPADFQTKLDTLIETAVEIAMLKAPDGVLRTMDRCITLRRELIEHDEALRASSFEEHFDKLLAQTPSGLKLDEPPTGTAIGPHAREENVVFAEALSPLTGEDIDHLIRNHYPGCTLPPQHAGKCCIERGPHTCKR